MDKEAEIFKLKKEIDRLRNSVKKQRYGLVWMDVPEAFEDDVENKLPILKEVPDLAIKNDDQKPCHILIEGDNYHTLTCLNYTHKGKIDVIYIDPPYNTGSDGFRYKDKRIIDKFPDGTEVPINHPFRHSYWLSFMRKRLELSRDLLSKRGVIFISVDDNEIAQLKLLCNEIFQESNFVSMFIWKKRSGGGYTNTLININQEYILCYAKDIKIAKFNDKEKDENGLYKKYPLTDKKGVYKRRDLRKSGSADLRKDRPTMYYAVTAPDGKKILPVRPDGRDGRWSCSKETFEELLKSEEIEFVKSNNLWKVYTKERPFKENGELKKEKYESILYDLAINTQGTNELKKYFPENDTIFDYPKPPQLIKHLLKMSAFKNSIILDFFAGTGTTFQATLELNRENEGNMQTIICTNNENDICSKVCYPRIKRIINGYKNSDKIESLGGSLKYYQTAFIGKNGILNATDSDKIELAHNAGELLAIAENTLELVKENKYYQLFENNLKKSYTAIYFREELDQFDKFVEMIEKLNRNTTVYVFSWGNDEFVGEFENIKNIKVKTIPLPILEIYKNIYNLQN